MNLINNSIDNLDRFINRYLHNNVNLIEFIERRDCYEILRGQWRELIRELPYQDELL